MFLNPFKGRYSFFSFVSYIFLSTPLLLMNITSSFVVCSIYFSILAIGVFFIKNLIGFRAVLKFLFITSFFVFVLSYFYRLSNFKYYSTYMVMFALFSTISALSLGHLIQISLACNHRSYIWKQLAVFLVLVFLLDAFIMSQFFIFFQKLSIKKVLDLAFKELCVRFLIESSCITLLLFFSFLKFPVFSKKRNSE